MTKRMTAEKRINAIIEDHEKPGGLWHDVIRKHLVEDRCATLESAAERAIGVNQDAWKLFRSGPIDEALKAAILLDEED